MAYGAIGKENTLIETSDVVGDSRTGEIVRLVLVEGSIDTDG